MTCWNGCATSSTLKEFVPHPGVAGFEGPDAGAIHQSRGGVLTGIVSVPCRYTHSPFSTCRLTDFDHTWRLLAAFCKAAPGV